MGLRMDTREEVEAIKTRLNAAGFATEDATQSAACDALESNFWVRDPSRYRREVYVVMVDSETAG